jgi:hypothetical protein
MQVKFQSIRTKGTLSVGHVNENGRITLKCIVKKQNAMVWTRCGSVMNNSILILLRIRCLETIYWPVERPSASKKWRYSMVFINNVIR